MDGTTFWYIQRQMEELIDLAEDRGVDEESWFMGGWNSLCARWQPRLHQKLVYMCIHNSDKPILPTKFPIPFKNDDMEAVTNGPYKIGVIKDTDIEYSLWPLQLQMHGVIGGATGFGKSMFICGLSSQILSRNQKSEHKVRIWIIDPKPAGDYRGLARKFDDVLVLGRSQFKCNPCDANDSTSLDILMENISEITADSMGVYDAGEGVILHYLGQVFDEFKEPTFVDFIRKLEGDMNNPRDPWSRYLATINTRIAEIKRTLKDIIDCKYDYFPELFDKSVVFETGRLMGSTQRILVPWIINKLLLHKIDEPTPYLSHLLVFDEAQAQLWSRHLEERGRTSYMATLATTCRAFGLGILVLAQNPAKKLMSEIIANSTIKICFHMNSGEEIWDMAVRHMGLNEEQKDELYHLRRGEAVCRLGEGYTEPVLLKMYHSQDDKVSDDELREMMGSRWEELLGLVEPPEQEAGSTGVAGAPAYPYSAEADLFTAGAGMDLVDGVGEVEELDESVKEEPKVMESKIELSEDEEAYLRIVKNFPWRLIGEVYGLLGNREIMGEGTMGQAKAVRIRKKLIKKKYLETFNVKETGRSGRSMCDVLTEKSGMEMAYKPRGGFLHSWWSYRVSEYYLGQGAEVSMGETFDGNEMDVAVRMDDMTIGIEVVVTELVVDNLAKHLSCYDEVRVLCIDEAKKKEVERRIGKLGNDIQEKVKIELLKCYFIPL